MHSCAQLTFLCPVVRHLPTRSDSHTHLSHDVPMQTDTKPNQEKANKFLQWARVG